MDEVGYSPTEDAAVCLSISYVVSNEEKWGSPTMKRNCSFRGTNL